MGQEPAPKSLYRNAQSAPLKREDPIAWLSFAAPLWQAFAEAKRTGRPIFVDALPDTMQIDMADAAKGVTKAQHDVLRADQDLAQAQRRLVSEQAKETKLNTAAVRANTRVMKQLIDVQKAKNRLEKPKPGGTAAAVSGDLAKAGAVLP